MSSKAPTRKATSSTSQPSDADAELAFAACAALLTPAGLRSATSVERAHSACSPHALGFQQQRAKQATERHRVGAATNFEHALRAQTHGLATPFAPALFGVLSMPQSAKFEHHKRTKRESHLDQASKERKQGAHDATIRLRQATNLRRPSATRADDWRRDAQRAWQRRSS